jgi:pimeloyl-ACP methyl ester carboxylesterase
MSVVTTASNTTASTQFLRSRNETYAYRRFGSGPGRALVCLQHFTGTLDNWDPAVTDPLASGREVILFDSAGVGRSTGSVPNTVAGMAAHGLDFLDGLGLSNCDVLGFSLGGMVAQQMARDRPSIFRRMILVGTAPRGGEDIMHLDKPSLARHLGDPSLKGYAVLQKISSRQLRRARRPAAPLSRGFRNGPTTSTPHPDQTSRPHSWRRSGTGSNLQKSASAISEASISPRSSSTAYTTTWSPSRIRIGWPRTFRMRFCSYIRTLDTARSSSFTTPSPGTRRPFSRRTRRSHLTDQWFFRPTILH